MIVAGRRSTLLLLAGDIAAFAASLYLALALRHRALPRLSDLEPYLIPFGLLFGLWFLVFYAAGLYSKRLVLFPSRMPDTLIRAQLANTALAIAFFFLVPTFGITPKTILVLDFIISLVLVYLWRAALYPRVSAPRARERIVLLGGADSDEVAELLAEVNSNSRYGIELVLPPFGEPLALSRYQSVAFEDFYEEVFDRIPLSALGDAWFFEYASSADSASYVVVKRAIDVIGGILMGLVTLVMVPFLLVANRLEAPGPLFIAQQRFGFRGARINAYKFRSMTKNLYASGEWMHEGDNRVTKVGAFLRTTSLDEFPQFVNVLKGEISLVGPRNDITGLGERLRHELPYYDARYLVKPGITGWAQINQQYEPGNASPQSVEETKVRLAYDFYYLKHRSLGLDLTIALRTIKRMFFRVSSW